MRFLIDNSLSPRFAHALQSSGHEASHVRDHSMASAADLAVFQKAEQEGSVVVAQDTDFGTLLALRQSKKPSVILFRCQMKSTEGLISILLANLPSIEADLRAGAVAVFEDARIRVRRLPIAGGVGDAS